MRAQWLAARIFGNLLNRSRIERSIITVRDLGDRSVREPDIGPDILYVGVRGRLRGARVVVFSEGLVLFIRPSGRRLDRRLTFDHTKPRLAHLTPKRANSFDGDI